MLHAIRRCQELLLLALLALLAVALHVIYSALWMLVILWLLALFAEVK